MRAIWRDIVFSWRNYRIEAHGNTYERKELLKRLGFRWDGQRRVWFRDDETLVRGVVSAEEREVAQAVNSLVEKIRPIKERKILEVANRLPFDFDVGLRNYQKIGVYKILQNKRFLLAYKMGLGKTITALGAGALYKKQKGRGSIIYILPNPDLLVPQVAKEAQRVHLSSIVFSRKRFKGVPNTVNVDTALKYDVVIFSYAMFRGHYPRIEGRLKEAIRNGEVIGIFADEAHKIKEYKALQTRRVFDLLNYARQYHALVVFMTGTPTLGKPKDVYNMYRYLVPYSWGYRRFMERYHGAHEGYYGLELGEPQNLEELHDRLRPYMQVVNAEDVAKELPSLNRHVLDVSVELPSRGLLYSGSIGDLQRYKHQLAMNKTVVIPEIVEEAVPCLIFTDFEQVATRIAELVEKKVRVGVISGKITGKKRAQNVKDFNEGRLDALVIVSSAGGVGLNLQRAENVIFNDLPWSAGDFLQAESRAHRMTTDHPVFTTILRVVDSDFDRELVEFMFRKIEVISVIMTGQAGEEASFLEAQEDFRKYFISKYRSISSEEA